MGEVSERTVAVFITNLRTGIGFLSFVRIPTPFDTVRWDMTDFRVGHTVMQYNQLPFTSVRVSIPIYHDHFYVLMCDAVVSPGPEQLIAAASTFVEENRRRATANASLASQCA